MAASLVPLEGGSPIALDKPIMLIGRNQDCDISLQVSSKISRRHCCIVQCGDRFVLRDLGSMNGVRVNSNRTVEAELHSGDEVAVADVAFTFHRDDSRTNDHGRAAQRNSQADPVSPDAPAGAERGRSIPLDPLPRLDEPELEEPASEGPELEEESDHEHPSRTYSDDQILDNEVRLKHDSESEAGFVRV